MRFGWRAALGFMLGLSTWLAACGGGGAGGGSQSAAIGTLAYVDTVCREGADRYSVRQSLLIRQGEHDPVPVFEEAAEPVPVTGTPCKNFGQLRTGEVAVFGGVFQRFSVSPDGSAVVFEVTDDFSVVAPNQLIAPDREGIYFVRAEGSGLRRLGPASREANFRSAANGASDFPWFSFSPDGRFVTFADLGPDEAGKETVQVVTLNVLTGERKQVTHLPFAPELSPPFASTGPPAFISNDVIGFGTNVNVGWLNPSRDFVAVTVNADGTNLKVALTGTTVLTPGGPILLHLAITGSGRIAVTSRLPEGNLEIFVFDGINLLQVTNFGRVDTAFQGAFVGVDGQRVFFSASADPLGRNPTSTCQLFSVGALGGDLQQLTSFTDPEPSQYGCALGALQPPLGCVTVPNNGYAPSQDARTGTLVFASSCDPFGTNPNGGQLFAMRPDGTGLRQLTDDPPVKTDPDGSVTVELPGPYTYGPYR